MCGICEYLDRSRASAGPPLNGWTETLGCRGPDAAGLTVLVTSECKPHFAVTDLTSAL